MALGLFAQIALSARMTAAAFRMTMRYPASLAVAFLNLLFMIAVAVVPITTMIWLVDKDPDRAWWTFRYVFQFWFVADAWPDFGEVAWRFTVWLVFIYGAWVTLVTFGSLVATTVIMHTGVMQLRGQPPSLAEGARVAGANVLRLLGLAVITGTLMATVKYFSKPLRAIPFVGRWASKAIAAAITGALYVTLPVVVYERKGAWSGFRETWRHVRGTWGGLVVGTGLAMWAVWLGAGVAEVAAVKALENLVGRELVSWGTVATVQVVLAVLLYCLNVALSANLRAALYLHVVEGHTGVIPAGALAGHPTQVPSAFPPPMR